MPPVSQRGRLALRGRAVWSPSSTPGPALLAAGAAGAVVKPNLDKLRSALDRRDLEGHDRAARTEVVAAARQVQELGANAVVVTLGRHGAIAGAR